MGIMDRFSRRRETNNSTLPVTDKNHHGSHRNSKTPVAMDFSKRPTFGQWLKVTLIDLLTMLAMGMIGLGVYFARPAPSRSFPVDFQDGEIVYPEFAYPLRNEIVPIWAAALLAALVPIAVFLIVQIRVRSFWDVNNATIGLFYSLITAAVFQVFLKWLIGGLRPHFLAVCKPVIPVPASGTDNTGNGFRQIMYDRKICTGDEKEINDALESFPSGHSTAAFAGFIFLAIYLNAKLKLFSNYHPAMWKLIAVYAPVLGAVLIAGALTIDEFHNWYDCLAGAIIGTVMAFSSYRMVYCSIWDWRNNHIPLNRSAPFAGEGGLLDDAVWTRKAGWGVGSGYSSGHHHGNGIGSQNNYNNGVTNNGHTNGHGFASNHHNETHGNGIPAATSADQGYTHSRKPVGSGHHRAGSDTVV